jgi:hypothetical protein
MRQMLFLCTVTIGFSAAFAAAQAAGPNTGAPGRQMAINIVATTPALETRQLQTEMQSLQTEMQMLLTEQKASNTYNLAELENLPTGG